MHKLVRMNIILCGCLLVFMGPAIAEIYRDTGVVLHSSLPEASIQKASVQLRVPHIQQRPWLCVPTSSAMVLSYFGRKIDPRNLKQLAENHKPKSKQNQRFTYFRDIHQALRKIGYNWQIRNYRKSDRGFDRGLAEIKLSLLSGRPVLIDVHLGQGHTFVVTGFNDNKKIVYIRDPDIRQEYSRILSYKEMRKSWHNHRFHKSRSAIFSNKKNRLSKQQESLEAPATPKYEGDIKVLKSSLKAADNSLIKQWQSYFKRFGYYNGKVDGVYGRNTAIAILQCSRDSNCTN